MDSRRPIAVLDAPSNLGLSPPAPGTEPGARYLAEALRATGVVSLLRASNAGQVTPPPYSPDRDTFTGVRNAPAIAEYSTVLADRIEVLLNQEHFPLLLGGDCSVLLGCMLALRRRGRYGLAYIDAHLDFRHPGHGEEVGAAAGEVLALLTGRGTPLLADLEGKQPLVREKDIVSIGTRDTEARDFGVAETGITQISARDIKHIGAHSAAQNALDVLEKQDLDGYWIQIDADVLDGSLMPAVDSPEPDGLNFAELADVLGVLAGSSRVTGAVVTIFDPTLDRDGSLARELADTVVDGFTRDN